MCGQRLSRPATLAPQPPARRSQLGGSSGAPPGPVPAVPEAAGPCPAGRARHRRCGRRAGVWLVSHRRRRCPPRLLHTVRFCVAGDRQGAPCCLPWPCHALSLSRSCPENPPGKEATLPLPPPLRTVRARFHAYRSSLSNAPCGTRLHDRQPLAVDLMVTRRMQQHQILCGIPPALAPGNQMVLIPSGLFGDGVEAEGAAALLLLPEGAQHPFVFRDSCPPLGPTGLEVVRPGRIIWVGCSLDLGVSGNGDAGGGEQPDRCGSVWLVTPHTVEHPVPCADRVEVVVPNPAAWFVGMSAFSPLPDGVEDPVVHLPEGHLARSMPVIIHPASEDGVELADELPGRSLRVAFDEGTDFPEQRGHALAGGGDEHFLVIPANVVAEKVKALCDMRDAGFFG